MTKKRLINAAQNLTLLALLVLALFLLSRFTVINEALTGQVQAFLSAGESGMESADLTGVIGSVHLAVTGDGRYGRYTRINVSADSAELQRVAPLFREAIGSASTGEAATDTALRAALESPGIYLDLRFGLPMAIAAAWLGESLEDSEPVRALALTVAQETVTLFLCRPDGTVVRCSTALPAAAVLAAAEELPPNGGSFAYESDYPSLSPYTILVQEVDAIGDMTAGLPQGYTASSLLTALDFNAHTNARYTESGGVEVVVQSPRTLRIGTDGTVRYSAAGEVPSELYQIGCAAALPTAVEALRGAVSIAGALTAGTAASPLTLSGMEKTENGWIVSFGYCVDGTLVHLSQERPALRVTVSGDAVTKFEYTCRSYVPAEGSAQLLPPAMAAAIAAQEEGSKLSLGYVDSGAARISAGWFVE